MTEEKKTFNFLKTFVKTEIDYCKLEKADVLDILNIIEKLQKENEELKNKVVKRDKELIKLEEYANKNFERKDDVKAKYIPKDKIREKMREYKKLYESGSEDEQTEHIYYDFYIAYEELLEEE